MTKKEKVLSIIFSVIIASYLMIFALMAIYSITYPKSMHRIFSHFEPSLAVYILPAVISLAGMGIIIVNMLSRKRREKGKKVPSTAYTISFYASFVPFVLLLIYSIYSSIFGIRFLWSKSYGFDAFYLSMLLVGGLGGCVIIPVFPVCIFWQALYIFKYIRNRKKHQPDK